ncbi:GntR family transcriptional regulator [Dactylosporangium roseum]|uniref:GntR family transcriptional regulator n=1 Tax=Dactylosporangium roseum TaxID=47989 RepID=A0ABY5Z4G9_9ACTN|nr:GntR family transcriptional regulator [Dactylosporangium roseum]UWZ35742.1 GntR family transcriptional regulator [Dactylosporangium roseum]
MPIESSTPKYAEIINALQRRIDRQVYRAGDLLPSEAQLTREFGASRSTVVRALEYLRQHGWVEGVQGKGRIVLERPASRLSELPRRVQVLLQADRHATLLNARRVAATVRIAAALACPVGAPLVARRYLLSLAGAAPFGLSTVFVSVDLAGATNEPPGGGFFVHIERGQAHRVVERLGARLASEGEAAVLGLERRRCLAVALLTVLDAADRPLLAVDAVLSRDVPELASSFTLA